MPFYLEVIHGRLSLVNLFYLRSFIGRLSLVNLFYEERLEDEDGSVIGYTHKGGGIIVVLRTGGFLER